MLLLRPATRSLCSLVRYRQSESQPAQRMDEACEREPHDGIKIAFNTLDERGAVALDAVGTGLVHGFPGCDVLGDLLLVERKKRHERALAMLHQSVSLRNGKRESRMHQMRAAGEIEQHPLGVVL